MAEAVGQVGGGVDVELVVFEKPLTLFVHGNTFPRHRRDLPSRKCYLCLENMCYRCPEKILLPMSWSRSDSVPPTLVVVSRLVVAASGFPTLSDLAHGLGMIPAVLRVQGLPILCPVFEGSSGVARRLSDRLRRERN